MPIALSNDGLVQLSNELDDTQAWRASAAPGHFAAAVLEDTRHGDAKYPNVLTQLAIALLAIKKSAPNSIGVARSSSVSFAVR